MQKQILEELRNSINSSTESYIKSQRIRIFRTIELLEQMNLISGIKNVLVVGGKANPKFDKLFELTFNDAKITYTDCDLQKYIRESSDQFDLAICTEVLEHIGDVPYKDHYNNFSGVINLINEIARVLVPEGHCLLTTPNITGYLSLALILIGSSPFMYPGHYREYSRHELERILLAAGVNIKYFNAENVFMKHKNVIECIDEILDSYHFPSTDRGDDFFVIFQKPFCWKENVLQSTINAVYPDLPTRENLPPYSIFRKVAK